MSYFFASVKVGHSKGSESLDSYARSAGPPREPISMRTQMNRCTRDARGHTFQR